MNAHEIVKAFTEAGIGATDVAIALRVHAEIKKAYQEVESDYPTRCAQTVLLAATVDSKIKSQAKLAEEAAVTSMTMGRWCAAGRVLIVHANLDPVAMVAYANANDKKTVHALTMMTEDEASEVIAPKKAQKSDAEKDFEVLARAARRAKDARESGDPARIKAFREALYAIGDALDATDAEEEVA